jgi:hypothetical protein
MSRSPRISTTGSDDAPAATVLLRPKAGTTSPRPEFPGRMPAQEPCGRGGTRLRTRERRLIVNLPAGPQDIELDAGTWS